MKVLKKFFTERNETRHLTSPQCSVTNAMSSSHYRRKHKSKIKNISKSSILQSFTNSRQNFAMINCKKKIDRRTTYDLDNRYLHNSSLMGYSCNAEYPGINKIATYFISTIPKHDQTYENCLDIIYQEVDKFLRKFL